jgi:catechol 2,3-dioxygenase-like lactoylglutathione lyase family enzyme
MTTPQIESMSPFFIVSNVDQIIAFYQEKLGFETQYKEPDAPGANAS